MTRLGNIPPARCEGSRGRVAPSKVASDQPDTTQYHETSEGTRIPLNSTIDPNKGLSQFTVVDYDGDTITNIQEPEVEGEDQCPSQPSQESLTSKAKPASSRRQGGPQKKLIEALQQSVDELSKKLETTMAAMKASMEASSHSLLSSVSEKLSSLMSDLESSDALTKTSQSPLQIPDGSWRAVFSGSFGNITVYPAVVDIRSETTVVLLYDPDSPSFVPAKADEPITLSLSNGEYSFDLSVIPNGWSTSLMLGEKDYTLAILSLA